MAKKRKEWLVQWKGFSHAWESLEHLSGCKQYMYIARFEEERDRKQTEDDDARGQKRKRRDDDEEVDTSQELASILTPGLSGGKRSSLVWHAFVNAEDKQFAICMLKMVNGTSVGLFWQSAV